MARALSYRSLLSRRRLLETAGGATLALASPPASADAVVKLPLPGGPDERPITTAFPEKGALILQRTRPPLLETPFEVFDQSVFTPNDRFYVRWHWAVIPTEIDVGSVCCQLLPPSLENSTRDTPESPPNAMPRASVWAPARNVSPGLMFVMKDRGTIRLIGTNLTPVWPGLMLACGVSGIVQAVFIQQFVSGWSSTSMSLSDAKDVDAILDYLVTTKGMN